MASSVKPINKINFNHALRFQSIYSVFSIRDWNTDRPAALPYWTQKRMPAPGAPQLPTPEYPVTDAITGATPPGDVEISTTITDMQTGKIRLLLEINQPWDWNKFWTNDLYDDVNYRTSCQPSIIYAVTIDLDQNNKEYFLNPIGHGHYSGATGELFTDLSTITTALQIVGKVSVTLNK